MKKMNKKGFTLTELVIVIVIIAILAAVLIPSMTGYVNRAKKSNATQEAANTYTVFAAWLVDETDANGYSKTQEDNKIVKTAATYYTDDDVTTIGEKTYLKSSLKNTGTEQSPSYALYTTSDENPIAEGHNVEKASGDLKTAAVYYTKNSAECLKAAFENYLAEASDTTVASLKTTVQSVSVTETNGKVSSAKVVILASNKYYVTINYADGTVSYTDPTTAVQA